MSVSGISSTNLFNYSNQNLQNNLQPLQQEFQQLSQNLQSGDLSSAQQDFSTLQQPGSHVRSIVQAFNQLGQDLQSGNVSAAQKDYTNVKQDYQNYEHTRVRHYHAMRSGDGELSQTFSQLGQALQSGNVSSAQTAYNSLLQDPPQLGVNLDPTSAQTSSSANSISVNA
jgi:protein subunit release factor A